MIYVTSSISLLDQCTSQPVICSRWDGQTGLSGRWHPLSHHYLDCERRSPLRSVTAPTTGTLVRLFYLLTIPLFVFVFITFSATAVEPRRSLTESGSLVLKDVIFGDTATYQCQASNKHGTIITNTNVYVIGEYLFSVGSFFNRKCAVASYFSFLLCSRAASSDPHWEWEHVHFCWRPKSSAGVWNLWLS